MKSKKQKRDEALARMEGYEFLNSKAYRVAMNKGLNAEAIEIIKQDWQKANSARIVYLSNLIK